MVFWKKNHLHQLSTTAVQQGSNSQAIKKFSSVLEKLLPLYKILKQDFTWAL